LSLELVHPEGWEAPRGYSNGVVAPPGARLVFVAGQIAWDAAQTLVGRGDFGFGHGAPIIAANAKWHHRSIRVTRAVGARSR